MRDHNFMSLICHQRVCYLSRAQFSLTALNVCLAVVFFVPSNPHNSICLPSAEAELMFMHYLYAAPMSIIFFLFSLLCLKWALFRHNQITTEKCSVKNELIFGRCFVICVAQNSKFISFIVSSRTYTCCDVDIFMEARVCKGDAKRRKSR